MTSQNFDKQSQRVARRGEPARGTLSAQRDCGRRAGRAPAATGPAALKILFITRAWGQHAGGLERLSFELIQAISQNPRVSVQVIKHTGARITSPLFVFSCLPRALAAARHADVVHISDPMLSLAGWLIKEIFHKPIAVNVHGLDITYPSFLYQTYLKLFFRHFDAYFPISRHVNTLLDHWQVSGTQIVVSPGINDRFFDPSITRPQLGSFLNMSLTGRKVLLTVGRLIKRKGHAWFISNVLPKLASNTLYVIAGQGPEANNIKQSALLHQVSNRVILLGKVSDLNLKILYNTVDAFVQPNIKIRYDTEGFGLVLLEAALCRRPVFAADIDGVPDAIQDNKNGILVESNNPPAWINALNSLPSSVINSRAYTLANFSWEKAADRYWPALAKLPATPPS